MQHWLKHSLTALLLSLTLIQANALTVNSLYQTQVPVIGDSLKDWHDAIPLALQQVLIKVNGNPQVVKQPNITTKLNNASSLIESYHYAPIAPTTATQTGVLSVEFNPKAVNQLLTDSGQSIWGAERPLTLIWLAVNKAGQDNLVSNTTQDPLATDLQNAAEQRAVPLLWPTLDLQDIDALPITAMQNLTATTIQNAAKRYQPDVILAGNITQLADGSWQGQWLFISKQQALHWQSQGSSSTQVLNYGLDQLVNTLNTPLLSTAVSPEVNNTQNQSKLLSVTITNVNNLNDYAAAIKYLHTVHAISKMAVTQVSGSNLVLQIVLTQNQQALNDELNLQHQLIPVLPPANITDSGSTTSSNNNATATYQWTGNSQAATSTTTNTTAPTITGPTSDATAAATTPTPTTNTADTSSPSAPFAIKP